MDNSPLIIDSFAGGGGASTGIEAALGRSPNVAINHSEAALALHAVNHPDTEHLNTSIYRVDPREVVKSGQRVGLAWFSPDCKHFSKAKGGAPLNKNIRDLAWVVVHWAELVKPEVILLENVEEFQTWAPLRQKHEGGNPGTTPMTADLWDQALVEIKGKPVFNADGGPFMEPDPLRKGQTFIKWITRLRRLGYKVEWRALRACDHGAPTIRKRLFVVARCDGQPITWPAPTHGDPNSDEVKSGKLKPWRAAAECIDWSLPCPSIFDSAAQIKTKHGLRAIRPLADNTLARVARGMKRYVLEVEHPFMVTMTTPHVMTMRNAQKPFNGADEPTHTITASRKDQNAIIAPVIATLMGCGGRAAQSRPRGMGGPMATTTSKADTCIAAAFLAQHNSARRGVNPGRQADAPISTLTGSGSHQNVVVPWFAKYYGTDDPLHTITVKDRMGHMQAELAAPEFGPKHEARARQVADFLRDRNAWDGGEFVTLAIDGETFVVVDIGMRMLTPRELFNAQGFPPGYVIEGVWNEVGDDWTWHPFTKNVQVSCCGNSVCPPVAEALVRSNCAHLAVGAQETAKEATNGR